METSFEAEEPFLLAGAWYHELLQRPPTAHFQTIPIGAVSEQEADHEIVSDSDDSSLLPDSDESLLEPSPSVPNLNGTLTTFPLFPHLPIDLRLEIWQHCHPPPRNVILSFPQYAKSRVRKPDWDKQWIFPALPLSQFITLLINHESRDLFLTNYQTIFSDFPSDKKPKKDGRKAGWYFDPKKDSLCFGDGVRGLRWFMGQFPEERVWERVRYVDVDIDLNAFHIERKTNPLGEYFAQEGSALVLGKMRELRLVTMRVVVVRFQQWRHRKNGYWRPWENSAKMLKAWLRGRLEENSVKLAMQYIWTDGGAVASYTSSKPGHEVFLAKFPAILSGDVRKRWVEIGIFLHDGANKTQAVYDTEKEIYCRNLVVELHTG